jgi:hypothetical protein
MSDHDKEERKMYRLFISLWCLLLGLNIYWGITSYFVGDWGGVGISAIMISWMWKNIWRDFDESRGISREDDDNGAE